MIKKKWSLLFLLIFSNSTNFAVKSIKNETTQKKSKTSTVIKQFTCKICNHAFKTKGKLKEHIETHFKTTYCHLCPDYGRSKNTTVNHIKIKHNLTIKEAKKLKLTNPSEMDNFLVALHQHGIVLKKKNNQIGKLAFVLDETHSPSPQESTKKNFETNINTSNTHNMMESDEILTSHEPVDFDIDSLFV